MRKSRHDVFRLRAPAGAHWTFLSDEDLQVQRDFDIDGYTDVRHI